jgi:hypothetical protein
MRSLLFGAAWIAIASGCAEPQKASALVGGMPDLSPPTSDVPRCGGEDFALDHVPPNIMLVLDRSASMIQPIAGGSTTTKYEDLKGAIATLVWRYDETMRFGATFFASDDDCRPGVVGAVAAQNGATVRSQLDAQEPGGNTPTAATLDAVIRSHVLADPSRANYLVLATDGIPNCDDVDVRARIAALYAATPSVRTFIIGIGSETSSQPDLLGAWADAGHTTRAGDVHYYQSNSSTALDAAFDAIAGDIVTCDFRLSAAPDNPADLEVSEDGVALPPSATMGWTFDPTTQTLTLHGAACDTVKNEAHAKVSVSYACPQIPIL